MRRGGFFATVFWSVSYFTLQAVSISGCTTQKLVSFGTSDNSSTSESSAEDLNTELSEEEAMVAAFAESVENADCGEASCISEDSEEPPAIEVTTLEDNENSEDGLCSVREALKTLSGTTSDSACVLLTTSSNIISLPDGIYCISNAIEITADVALRGSNSTVLDGGNGTGSTCDTASNDRVLWIDSGLNVTLEKLTIQGGTSSSMGGGGIFAESSVSLTIKNTIIRDNSIITSSSALGGGGLYLGEQGTLTITDSTFTSNHLECNGSERGNCALGGGIHVVESGSVSISNSTLSNNEISAAIDYAAGGGIHVGADSNLSLSSTTVSGNAVIGNGSSGAHGGGVSIEDCESIQIIDSLIESNSVVGTAARAFGGGLAVGTCDSMTISQTSVRSNHNLVSADVGAYGGGMFLSGITNLSISSSTFSNNVAEHLGSIAEAAYGGGLYISSYLDSTTPSLLNVTMSGNTSQADGDAYGGGIMIKGYLTVYFSFCTIAYNNADGDTGAYGGGIGHFPSSESNSRFEEAVLLNSILAYNTTNAGNAKGPNCYQFTYSLGNNFIEDDTNCTLVNYGSSSINDHVDQDPLLTALADDGYGIETHTLASDSPARGQASCLDWNGTKVTQDTRGVSRDLKCDVGAWEYED